MDENRKMIQAKVIIEMLGAPREHIDKTMELLMKKMSEDSNLKLIEYDIADSEEKDEMWSLFTEADIEVKDSSDLLGFCFDYMPSSIEIIEPDRLVFTSMDFGHLINDIQGRLHEFDMTLKGLSAENRTLKKNGTVLLHNLVNTLIGVGKSSLPELSAGTGVPEDQLKKFLDVLVKEKKLTESDGNYSIQ